MIAKINVAEKLSRIHEYWRPHVVGELNGQEVKVVKFQGEFLWHTHAVEDEMFLVVKGAMRIDFRDRSIALNAGEFLIVPHGVEHRTAADHEAEVMIFEPAAVRNTGDKQDAALTAPMGLRI
ncbi:MAG TPA: cupin domain-containing protein [Rudaea sp.]|jgi:mannose-6-phosphate isomerase-like protein (cupin superfamily)|nr:cupin domain-containing protein [Rudaea sp.]